MSIIGPLKISAQLMCGAEPAIGPGKALVLEAIEQTGSISAAGRQTGMSYRRIWLLVDSLNRCWDTPLVRTSAGGRGGSHLTERGLDVLRLYRAMEARMAAAAQADDYRELLSHVRSRPVAPAIWNDGPKS